MMAQFPFAHTITMTYRLANGALEVETTLQNLSDEPMPVAIGFHPYFNLHDSPRDQWKVHLAARDHLVLSSCCCLRASANRWNLPTRFPSRACSLTTCSATWSADRDGRAQFWVEGKKERITVSYGPQVPGSSGVCAAGARVHLLRAYGGHYQRPSAWRTPESTRSCKASPRAVSGERASGLRPRASEKEFSSSATILL